MEIYGSDTVLTDLLTLFACDYEFRNELDDQDWGAIYPVSDVTETEYLPKFPHQTLADGA